MPLTEPDLWISHIRLFNSPHVTGANGSGQDFWKALCICPFLHPLVRECHKAPFSACCLPTDFCRYPIAEAKFAFRRDPPLPCTAKPPNGDAATAKGPRTLGYPHRTSSTSTWVAATICRYLLHFPGTETQPIHSTATPLGSVCLLCQTACGTTPIMNHSSAH